MSDASDFRDLLQGHYATAEAKRLVAWGKVAVSFGFSVIVAVAVATWWLSTVIHDLQSDIREARTDIHYLREHIDSVEKTAIDAKKEASEAKLMTFAMKGGYPPGVKTQ